MLGRSRLSVGAWNLFASSLFLAAALGLAGAAKGQPRILWTIATKADVLRLQVGRNGVIYAKTYAGISVITPDGALVRDIAQGTDVAEASAGDGTIYVTFSDGHTSALDPQGRVQWSGRFGPVLAVASDGTLYARCANDLCAFSPKGTLKWRFAPGLPQGIRSIALGTNRTLYALLPDEGIIAIGPNAAIKWRFRDFRLEMWLATGEDGTIYTLEWSRDSPGNYIYGLSPDGTLKWKVQTSVFPGSEFHHLVLERGGVIFSEEVKPNWGRDSATGVMKRILAPGAPKYMAYAIDARTGAVLWSFEKMKGHIMSLVMGNDGGIYVGSYDGHIYALDPRTGALRWRFWTGGKWGEAPVAVLAAGKDGTIYTAVRNVVEAITSP